MHVVCCVLSAETGLPRVEPGNRSDDPHYPVVPQGDRHDWASWVGGRVVHLPPKIVKGWLQHVLLYRNPLKNLPAPE